MDYCLLRHTRNRYHAFRVALCYLSFAFLLISLPEFFLLNTANAAAPVVDATAQGPAIKDIKTRLKRVETRLENQGLVDLMKRFDQLQRDMQRIIGDLEVQSHQLQTMKKQQKDLYADIDRRLRKLEKSPATTSGVPVSPAPALSGGVPTTPVPVTPAGSVGGQAAGVNPATVPATQQSPQTQSASMSEVERNVARSAYERAFNLLKQRRYKLAIQSFKAFLETYPYASYADNAQYWLGEANYANKKYETALNEFQKVVSKYPNSPKRADALLKIGYTYAELGNKKMAMHTLNTIVSTYPGSTAAKLAQKRIKALKR